MDYTRPFNIAANAHTIAVLKEDRAAAAANRSLPSSTHSPRQGPQADPSVTAESSERLCACSSARSSRRKIRARVAQLASGPWRGTVDASLLLIDALDRPRARGGSYGEYQMMTAEPMITRGAHYTALLDTIDHQGATKLHAREREQLLEAADVLLFGEPDSEQTVRWAEVLIEDLETSERWSTESCDQLREHLHGCAAPTGAS